ATRRSAADGRMPRAKILRSLSHLHLLHHGAQGGWIPAMRIENIHPAPGAEFRKRLVRGNADTVLADCGPEIIPLRQVPADFLLAGAEAEKHRDRLVDGEIGDPIIKN